MEEGNVICFRYKGGRHVRGVVESISAKYILLILQTDYIGKNEEWFIGEQKVFNKAEMKRILILTK